MRLSSKVRQIFLHVSETAVPDILKTYGNTDFSVYSPCCWNSLSSLSISLDWQINLFMFFLHVYSYLHVPHLLTHYQVKITTNVKQCYKHFISMQNDIRYNLTEKKKKK